MASDTQNVTFRLPTKLVAKAKQVAASHGTSLTALVVEGLTRATSGNEEYVAARDRQLALMHEGRRLRDAGEQYAARDTLHER